MFYSCPECDEPMEYVGGATDLSRSLHLFTCLSCKIEMQKEVESLYPVYEHYIH